VGGLGSLTGAALAALLIGQLHAFGILVLPKITLVLIFLVMAVVLVLRPRGLMGRPPEPARAGQGAAEPPIGPAPPALLRLGAAALAAALLLPLAVGGYGLAVLTELAVFVLFAASLHFIMGPGGMASFGARRLFRHRRLRRGAGGEVARRADAGRAGAGARGGGRLRPPLGYFCVRLSASMRRC
jgi:branched-chain amino acid transport system permease protein